MNARLLKINCNVLSIGEGKHGKPQISPFSTFLPPPRDPTLCSRPTVQKTCCRLQSKLKIQSDVVSVVSVVLGDLAVQRSMPMGGAN